jgi:hypothetical protein
MAAPMAHGASRDVLNEPMQPGTYAIASVGRKTVLQLDLFAREQAPAFNLPSELSGELRKRAEGFVHISTILFRQYDPEVFPAVRLIVDVARRLAELSSGVIADPLAETYRLPADYDINKKLDIRIDFREVASIRLATLNDGYWLSTRGLCKFNLPEFEMYGIPDNLKEIAATMLVSAGQQSLIGMQMNPGETAFSNESPLEVVQGTRSLPQWAGRKVLEFRDVGGVGAARGVEAWSRNQF